MVEVTTTVMLVICLTLISLLIHYRVKRFGVSLALIGILWGVTSVIDRVVLSGSQLRPAYLALWWALDFVVGSLAGILVGCLVGIPFLWLRRVKTSTPPVISNDRD
jgi:hypothetical protein